MSGVRLRCRDSAPQQHALCVLPWLDLPEAVAFGDVRLDAWSRVRTDLPGDVRATGDLIVGGFRSGSGRALDPTNCWFAARNPTADLSDDDAEALRERIFLLALAGLATNRYLSHRPQINASHFARVYQRFTPGTETVALVRRRRDGSITTGGVALAELVTTAPAAVEERAPLEAEQPFLDALATCIDAEDEVSTLIHQSLPVFLQGGELDEFETHGQDVVWIASAVEQVCAVEGRNKSTQMATQAVSLLGGEWGVVDKRHVRRWMSEFYAKRSEIHGLEAGGVGWPYWAHALLGTALYIGLVKQLLADAGRYELTDRDSNDSAGFPHRIACLIEADTRRQEEFARCWQESQWEGAFRRILRRFGVVD